MPHAKKKLIRVQNPKQAAARRKALSKHGAGKRR